MHFDDRLATVLRQPVTGEAVARVQFLQLVDLLGTMPSDAHGDLVESAFDRLAELSRSIPGADRARMLGNSGLRLRSPRLLAMLGGGDPQVASAALSAADLQHDEWIDLVPALPVHARGILRQRRSLPEGAAMRLERLGVRDRGLPAPPGEGDASGNAVPAATGVQGDRPAGIGAIVKRIEAYRRDHPPVTTTMATSPRLPLGDADSIAAFGSVTAFDFATDPTGLIVEGDANVLPMIFGTALGTLEPHGARRGLPLSTLVRLRQPIEGRLTKIDGAPAISGIWRIDAVPCFGPVHVGFTGYAGRARRIALVDTAALARQAENDRMRQVLHELRTPAGAIQLGAEMIQQQMIGPTPHEYRALAATIASDSALVLAGFEELERLVKLDAGAIRIEAGEADLSATVAAMSSQINRHMDARKSGFAAEPGARAVIVAMAPADLQKLAWRLLAGLGGATRPMEMLTMRLTTDENEAVLEIALPAQLSSLDDGALMNASAAERSRTLTSGMFGTGFTLRLARAEARSAGGTLERRGKVLRLALPLAQAHSANLSAT